MMVNVPRPYGPPQGRGFHYVPNPHQAPQAPPVVQAPEVQATKTVKNRAAIDKKSLRVCGNHLIAVKLFPQAKILLGAEF